MINELSPCHPLTKVLYRVIHHDTNVLQYHQYSHTFDQGLQILLMSGVSVTSASQILESFWNIWSQVS